MEVIEEDGELGTTHRVLRYASTATSTWANLKAVEALSAR